MSAANPSMRIDESKWTASLFWCNLFRMDFSPRFFATLIALFSITLSLTATQPSYYSFLLTPERYGREKRNSKKGVAQDQSGAQNALVRFCFQK
jgi:hypothetical protein